MKYKVGDVVKVREDLKVGKDVGNLFVAPPMVEFTGKLVTISSVNDDEDYFIEEDNQTYYWIDDFFEDNDEDCNVYKIIKKEEEEKKSDEYEDIIDKVLSEITEETKNKLIKELVKTENDITIVAIPVYEVYHRNGVIIREIVDTKYSVVFSNKEGMVKL